MVIRRLATRSTTTGSTISWYATVQEFFLSQLVVPAARQRGLAAEYEYLRPSIKAFPTGAEQEAMAKAAGFADAVHYDVSLGLMGCLVVTKADA